MYDHKKVENKWRDKWAKDRIFEVDLKKAKKPFYNLMMFPYPSGEGLHVGHVYAFGGADTFGRFKRMQGFDVFEPMGFDAFGIHSENYAIKIGQHPRELIAQTVEYFRENQLKKLGALFDWRYEVNTTDPSYYKWTQWLFLQLFKTGLAERKSAPVNFCPSCKTVLADEQVIAGKCERCESLVEERELEQWFFKITKYADRLLKNLDWIDWPQTTKTLQRNWIGRSEGVEIEFPLSKQTTDHSLQPAVDSSQLAVDKIKVFTTRPDTIYGATFMILAPEHPIVTSLKSKTKDQKLKSELETYIEKVKKEKLAQRVGTGTKTGIFTGFYCLNPFNKKEIPIWVSDYVSLAYGTGAIMAVPAHDERDFAFAKKYKLPIVEVIAGGDISRGAFTEEGKLVSSGEFSGLASKEAIEKISKYIEKNNLGKKTINYHLRDWLISRQRYWGPPIPMIFCQKCAKEGKSWFTTDEAKSVLGKHEILSTKHETHSKSQNSNSKKFRVSDLEFRNYANEMRGWYPVPEKDLPVILPDLKDFQPKGKGISPLATLEDWVKVACPSCGESAQRETDVSDTFLDSAWYYLAYVGKENSKFEIRNSKFKRVARKWLPVDSYIGGNEHATLHLLYVRFIWMVLYDLGFFDFSAGGGSNSSTKGGSASGRGWEEPFEKFRAHGLIIHKGAKMSKSRGNVVNPNEYIDKYGADTLRMYLLFIGPYNLGGDFSELGISGVYRFVNRVWNLVNKLSPKANTSLAAMGESANRSTGWLVSQSANDLRMMHQTIKKVGEDIENLRFNTAVAAIMEYVNYLAKKEKVSKKEAEVLSLILAPLAPHLAEELWKMVGNPYSVHHQKWPAYDAKYLREEKITIVVQVNGKLRDKLLIEDGMDEENIKNLAISSTKVLKFVGGKEVKNIILVPNRLVNIVTN